MTDPENAVILTDYVFSIGELQEFLDAARSIPNMAANAIVTIERLTDADPYIYMLRASDSYRSKQ